MLKNKNIGVFITGGIASYKIAELVRQLIKKGANIRVAMTQSATQFITPLTFQVLTKQPVLLDTFNEIDASSVQHIEMADWCDLAIVSPATANILAKMAQGIADDIVSTTLLATTAPRLIVPAMNVHMYENKATQRNIDQLSKDGYTIMTPDTGFLAEGYVGKGRLPEIYRIVSMAELVYARATEKQILNGKTVIITAGGTKERIDPVRYITNDSSGKMGYALATVATWLGAKVHLVSTNQQLPLPEQVTAHFVENAIDMQQVCQSLFNKADYLIMAAAVSDYKTDAVAQQKLKKQANQNGLVLQLVENPDILSHFGHEKTHQIIVGFAAETENILLYAQQKLNKKKADWIIANDVSQHDIGFNADENAVILLSKNNQMISVDKMSKMNISYQIWLNIVSK